MRLKNTLFNSAVLVLFPLHLTLQSSLAVLLFCDKNWSFGKPLLLSSDRREQFLSPERHWRVWSSWGSQAHSWVLAQAGYVQE